MQKLLILFAFMICGACAVSAQCQPTPECKKVCDVSQCAKTAAVDAPAAAPQTAVASAENGARAVFASAPLQAKTPTAKAANKATAKAACNPADCDPSKCDPSKCDPAQCDPQKCPPAQCKKAQK